MNNYIALLSKFDFHHWVGKNSYFSDDALSTSMRRGLKIIQNKGFLTDFEPSTAADFVNSIESLISDFDENNPDYKILARIFDLIQAWGGQMGRIPYVNKSRFKYNDWRLDYIDGVKQARIDKPVQALSSWFKIRGIGMSFASKHLRFWTNKYPVLDTQISLLVSGSKKILDAPEFYDQFIELIAPLSTKFCVTNLEVEKALFAFSQNFFKNGKFEFKPDIYDERDYHIAESLVNLSR